MYNMLAYTFEILYLEQQPVSRVVTHNVSQVCCLAAFVRNLLRLLITSLTLVHVMIGDIASFPTLYTVCELLE